MSRDIEAKFGTHIRHKFSLYSLVLLFLSKLHRLLKITIITRFDIFRGPHFHELLASNQLLKYLLWGVLTAKIFFEC